MPIFSRNPDGTLREIPLRELNEHWIRDLEQDKDSQQHTMLGMLSIACSTRPATEAVPQLVKRLRYLNGIDPSLVNDFQLWGSRGMATMEELRTWPGSWPAIADRVEASLPVIGRFLLLGLPPDIPGPSS